MSNPESDRASTFGSIPTDANFCPTCGAALSATAKSQRSHRMNPLGLPQSGQWEDAARFINERIEGTEDTADSISSNDLFNAYCEWRSAKGYIPLDNYRGRTVFFRALRTAIPHANKFQGSTGGVSCSKYQFVRLLPAPIEIEVPDGEAS